MRIYTTILLFLLSSSIDAQRSISRIMDENIFRSNDGQEKSFKELITENKGKVCYIDFWASWCGPCRKEMKYSKKMHEILKDENIVFLYISIDEQKEAWIKSMNNLGITESGLHYRRKQSEMMDFLKYFYIYSIPHYMIINAKGNIHNRDALAPSDPKLIRQLKKLLR